MTKTSWPVSSEVRDLIDAEGPPDSPVGSVLLWLVFVPAAVAVLALPEMLLRIAGDAPPGHAAGHSGP